MMQRGITHHDSWCDVHGKFPGKLESSNLSRDNLGREIGRNVELTDRASVGILAERLSVLIN